jgi:hypothetical protein
MPAPDSQASQAGKRELTSKVAAIARLSVFLAKDLDWQPNYEMRMARVS